MKSTFAAAALALGLGLAFYSPPSAQAAGAAGSAALPLVVQKDNALTEKVHYRHRHWRGGYGSSFYFAAPGFYGYYGPRYYRPSYYYPSYYYGPSYYRPYYGHRHHRHYRW